MVAEQGDEADGCSSLSLGVLVALPLLLVPSSCHGRYDQYVSQRLLQKRRAAFSLVYVRQPVKPQGDDALDARHCLRVHGADAVAAGVFPLPKAGSLACIVVQLACVFVQKQADDAADAGAKFCAKAPSKPNGAIMLIALEMVSAGVCRPAANSYLQRRRDAADAGPAWLPRRSYRTVMLMMLQVVAVCWRECHSGWRCLPSVCLGNRMLHHGS